MSSAYWEFFAVRDVSYGGQPAASAIPEGLPAAITVVMTVGARKMAGENALVDVLRPVETLGSTTSYLTDKTGTLTLNKMRVEELWVPDGGVVPFSADSSEAAVKGEGGTAITADESVRDLLTAMAYANDAQLADGNAIGDPTELALLAATAKVGIEKGRSKSQLIRVLMRFPLIQRSSTWLPRAATGCTSKGPRRS